MAQLYNTALEAAAASLFLIPVFLILNFFRFRSIKITLLYLIFAIYLARFYAVVGLPNVSYIRFEPNFNFIPLSGLLSDPSGAVLNVALFLPLGIFLFLLWKPFRCIRNVLLFGFFVSLTIEVLQIFTFRATDVNDLISNTTGALAGYGLGQILSKLKPSLLLRCRYSDLPLLICVSTTVMFLLQPLIWKMI